MGGTAVIAGLIAALVGAATSGSPKINFEFDENHIESGIQYLNREVSFFNVESEAFVHYFGIIAIIAFLFGILVLLIKIFLGSVVSVGHARFQLDLMDEEKQPQVGTLFQYFPFWKNAVVTEILKGVYITLWTLLLIFPGIIAAYSYAMTSYILAENPEMTARDAIRKSKEMMQGNRTRLFCLGFSFIGWSILSIMTLGIGNLWLMPYMYAAEAAFYRDLKKEKDNKSRTE